MPRAKRGFKARRRRNRLLKWAKGFRGKRSKAHAGANEAVQQGWRHFRGLWIQRINAAARLHGISYSKLIGKLGAAAIQLNRKMLAEIAISDPVAFKAIVS